MKVKFLDATINKVSMGQLKNAEMNIDTQIHNY